MDLLPLTHGGRIGFQIDNLLCAVAAGFWLGLSVDALRFGVQTFSSDIGSVPGRFNVLVHRDATVILDYGHNASALLALNEAISKMPHRRRKVVYTAAGDRRDEDIQRQAEIIGGFFDDVYIYEDRCTRGRADGEIIRLMREGMQRSKRPPRRVLQKSGELPAIAAAISGLEPGDLLLCQVDQVDVALEFVKGLFRQAEARPVVPIAQFAAAALAAPRHHRRLSSGRSDPSRARSQFHAASVAVQRAVPPAVAGKEWLATRSDRWRGACNAWIRRSLRAISLPVAGRAQARGRRSMLGIAGHGFGRAPRELRCRVASTADVQRGSQPRSGVHGWIAIAPLTHR